MFTVDFKLRIITDIDFLCSKIYHLYQFTRIYSHINVSIYVSLLKKRISENWNSNLRSRLAPVKSSFYDKGHSELIIFNKLCQKLRKCDVNDKNRPPSLA